MIENFENLENVDERSAHGLQAAAVPTGKMTPLMQQYWDVKSAHADKIVLFRMGDFFEMFHRDAEIAAPVLGIALTSRNKKSADETPMCGVPAHSVAGSINKLLQNGFRVAICDQVEDPKLAKGLVKRAVTRILTPGVVYDPNMVEGARANYLASVDDETVSFLDTTTGEAFYYRLRDEASRWRILSSFEPAEIVVPQSDVDAVRARVNENSLHALVSVFDANSVAARHEISVKSAARLIDYAVHLQGETVLKTLQSFVQRHLADRLSLPSTSVRHLEIFETYKGESQGSLYHAIDRTSTSSGARLLKQWLRFPLSNLDAIEERHERVSRWQTDLAKLKRLRAALSRMGDLHRRVGKLSSPSVNPRDLEALRASLEVAIEVAIEVSGEAGRAVSQVNGTAIGPVIETANLARLKIAKALVDEPPVQLKNGGLIRQGFSHELDEWIELSNNSNLLIQDLEAREREATKISSLKVRFNNVFGYYIEITNAHKDKVPSDRYERKQTLANAERYMTTELAEIESKVLVAQTKRVEIETAIFSDLVRDLLASAQDLLVFANELAELDVFLSFAWLALEQKYVRPRMLQEGRLILKSSRHPVVEQSLKTPFVANTIDLSTAECLLLTGPNMAGKSTLMRQVACAVIMAQAGCFVAADSAEMPVLEQLFTRIGASDFLSEGLSTFMVEMQETADMLRAASDRALVILDEVGRGTSTYDGMSLAQAILEFLLTEKKCCMLFATHYHELTQLSEVFPAIKNAHMGIFEKPADAKAPRGSGSEIIFLHRLVQGPASKSYGIHVAKLAGLPAAVTKRAQAILSELESRSRDRDKGQTQLSLLDFVSQEAAESKLVPTLEPTTEADAQWMSFRKELKALDANQLTPLEALNRIAQWQQNLS